MSKGKWEDVDVVCPFYLYKEDKKIGCSYDHARREKFEFCGSREAVERQFFCFCCTTWKTCPLARGWLEVIE